MKGEAVQTLLRILEEEAYLPTLKGVLKAAENELPPEDPAPSREALEALARQTLEEAVGQARRILRGLERALSLSLPKAEEAVRSGGEVEVWHGKGKGEVEVALRLGERRERLHLPLSPSLRPHHLEARVRAGMAEVRVHDLMARKGRAFLHAVRPGALEETREAVRAFHPLFAQVLGLPHLPEALAELSRLRDGEVRVAWGYLLARAGEAQVLGRGTFLGEPALDALLLTERLATLSYPVGLSLSLRLSFWRGLAALEEASLRWEGEAVSLDRVPVHQEGVLSPRFLARLLLKSTRYGLAALRPGLSPRMAAFLEEFGKSRDPLAALREEGFWERVVLKALTRA